MSYYKSDIVLDKKCIKLEFYEVTMLLFQMYGIMFYMYNMF